MKLYKVPKGSMIRLKPDTSSQHPIAHRDFIVGEVLEFCHIDGMYSLCFDKEGKPVHLAAFADVEVVDGA